MAESWKTTKVMDMTGEQLAKAVTSGVYRGIAYWVLISALVGVVFALLKV